MSSLRELLARTLAAEGALVELIEPYGLEIMAPAHVQQALGVSEWCRVGFGPELPPDAVRIGFESDWTGRLEHLLGDRGRWAHVFLSGDSCALPHDLDKMMAREFILQNAVSRILETEGTRTRYLLLVFHATASSDEKREEIVSVCLNESNTAVAEHMASRLTDLLQSRGTPGEGPYSPAADPPDAVLRNMAARLVVPVVRSQLAPFLAGMERRMARDLERLHAYHTGLRQEIANRLNDRTSKGNVEAARADQLRLEAVEREYHAKVADVRRKYAMEVEVRFLQALRADVPVHRAHVSVLRRKSSRRIHLDWNPVARRLDHASCEGCRTLPRVYSVCDERLHLVCPSCLSPCPSCARECCRACNPGKCSRCSHPWLSDAD